MSILEKIVDLLNEALVRDPEAMTALVKSRVPCNESLANHPTIQVAVEPGESIEYSLGLVGLLNGLSKEEFLCSVWSEEEDPKLTGFCVLGARDINWTGKS
jgi:hypothetical protein